MFSFCLGVTALYIVLYTKFTDARLKPFMLQKQALKQQHPGHEFCFLPIKQRYEEKEREREEERYRDRERKIESQRKKKM